MLHRDWQRIYDDLKEERGQVYYFREIGLTCLGLAVASFIGWVGWGPVYASMSADDKVLNNLQGPSLLLGAIAFAILTAAMLIADRIVRKRKGHDRDRILRDMEAVWKAATEGESGSDQTKTDV